VHNFRLFVSLAQACGEECSFPSFQLGNGLMSVLEKDMILKNKNNKVFSNLNHFLQCSLLYSSPSSLISNQMRPEV